MSDPKIKDMTIDEVMCGWRNESIDSTDVVDELESRYRLLLSEVKAWRYGGSVSDDGSDTAHHYDGKDLENLENARAAVDDRVPDVEENLDE